MTDDAAAGSFRGDPCRCARRADVSAMPDFSSCERRRGLVIARQQRSEPCRVYVSSDGIGPPVRYRAGGPVSPAATGAAA
jgi:hypothetical protein